VAWGLARAGGAWLAGGKEEHGKKRLVKMGGRGKKRGESCFGGTQKKGAATPLKKKGHKDPLERHRRTKRGAWESLGAIVLDQNLKLLRGRWTRGVGGQGKKRVRGKKSDDIGKQQKSGRTD